MKEIIPRFQADDRCDHTMFKRLKISDGRLDHPATQLANINRRSLIRVSVSFRIPKSDGSPDWRYAPHHKDWSLAEFCGMLMNAVAQGDITQHIDASTEHELFSSRSVSAASGPAIVRSGSAYLRDWLFEPIYHRGKFDDFADVADQLNRINQVLELE